MYYLILQRNIAYRGVLEYVVDARDTCTPPLWELHIDCKVHIVCCRRHIFHISGGDHIAKLKFGINNEMTFFIVHHVANMNIFFT